MKNIIGLLMLSMLFPSCGRKEEKVEILMEDGVEVVINRFEPYRIKGNESTLRLEEEFVIDLEDPSVSKLGLVELYSFAVNSAGEIFLLQERTEGDHLYKFSRDGHFLLSFARNGQGPGELSQPIYITTTPDGQIQVTDYSNVRVAVYRSDGSLAREVALPGNFWFVHPLENGLSVVWGRSRATQDGRFLRYPLELRDQDLRFLKLLDEFQIENAASTRRIQGTAHGFGIAFEGKRIFIANETRGYEIWVCDQEGNLVRKIRKKFHPLPVTEAVKEKALAITREDFKPLLFFPESLPPFQALFADEEGRLFVLTFEPAGEAGEYITDVFNPDGVFAGRLSADISLSAYSPLTAIVRAGRLYYIREKADGYKQLVVETILQE